MALIRLQTVINPATATAVASVNGGINGSAYLVYNTENINWGTLASKSGSGGAASTFFDYTLPGGGQGKAAIKGSIGALAVAATTNASILVG